jgi:hypothetical protein
MLGKIIEGRKKEEGRRKKDEGMGNGEEGRRKREEGMGIGVNLS